MRMSAEIFCEVAMVINRERYLNKLIIKKENGVIKAITGMRLGTGAMKSESVH